MRWRIPSTEPRNHPSFSTHRPAADRGRRPDNHLADFPDLWGLLLDEAYGFVRGHSELATGSGEELWQNAMLYKDDRPDVEVGVLVRASFEPDGRVIPSELPGGEIAAAIHRGDYTEVLWLLG